MSAAELGVVWSALMREVSGGGERPLAYSRILALLVLTGCRVSEITGLRIENVDLAAGSIAIAKGKTKDATRVLSLGSTARVLLAGAVEAAKGRLPGEHLFSAPRSDGPVDPHDISKAARALVADLGQQPWTPHDLRRSLVSQLHEMGFQEGIVRKLVGHTAKNVHDAVYDRSQQLEKIWDALTQYENYVSACAAETEKASESNVVALRAKA